MSYTYSTWTNVSLNELVYYYYSDSGYFEKPLRIPSMVEILGIAWLREYFPQATARIKPKKQKVPQKQAYYNPNPGAHLRKIHDQMARNMLRNGR